MPIIGTAYQGGSVKNVTRRVKIAQMGDGYMQVATDGINSIEEEIEVTFIPMGASDATFFENNIKSWLHTVVVDWQAPLESAPTKWKIPSYSIREHNGKVYEITVRFRRHYGV